MTSILSPGQLRIRAHTAMNWLAGISEQAAPHQICVIDVETSMEGSEADPAPYGPKGARTLLWAHASDISGPVRITESCTEVLRSFSTHSLIVGHHLKFDWQHLGTGVGPRTLRLARRLHRCMFWDTGIAEYILTGQQAKFPSLESVIHKYCPGKSKMDVLARYMKMGLRSQDVPLEELADYAKMDVELTREVMLAQWAAATPRQRILIIIQSMASIVFAEGELRGLRINVEEAVTRRDKEDRKYTGVKSMFRELITRFVVGEMRDPRFPTVDIGALAPLDSFFTPRMLSMVLFGKPSSVTLEAPLPVPIGRVKKAKATASLRPTWAVLDPAKYGAIMHKDGMSYLLHETVVKAIAAGASPVHADLANAILASRGAEKKANTYYQGLIECQAKYGDDRIHHTINVTATSTGRTSSSEPNSQNQPEEVKEIFEPEPDQVFCEFDFRQLEVWALAQLSKDPQLLEDIRSGVDIHYETGRTAGLWDRTTGMTKELRRRVKSVVFGLIYGGGVRTLADQAELPEATVKKIIDAFYLRYAGVKDYHVTIVRCVRDAKQEPTEHLWWVEDVVVKSETGSKRSRMMEVRSLAANTGRKYVFPESTHVASAGIPWSSPWSPTNIKNYPVQGFATGDIVPLAIVILDLMSHPDVQLLTAVHDSALNTVLDRESVKKHLDEVLIALPRDILEVAGALWGLEWENLPPGISVEWKHRWGGKPYCTYTA